MYHLLNLIICQLYHRNVTKSNNVTSKDKTIIVAVISGIIKVFIVNYIIYFINELLIFLLHSSSEVALSTVILGFIGNLTKVTF